MPWVRGCNHARWTIVRAIIDKLETSLMLSFPAGVNGQAELVPSPRVYAWNGTPRCGFRQYELHNCQVEQIFLAVVVCTHLKKKRSQRIDRATFCTEWKFAFRLRRPIHLKLKKLFFLILPNNWQAFLTIDKIPKLSTNSLLANKRSCLWIWLLTTDGL
jgi:hypothetical protein